MKNDTRNLTILFLYPVPRQTQKTYTGYHYGIGLISATLKKAGHLVSLLIVDQHDPDMLRATLDRHQPDLILATITSNQWYLAQQCLETCYSHRPLPILVGGPHPSAQPRECLLLPAIHAVCIGYGEAACRDYVHALSSNSDPRTIPGIMCKDTPETAPLAAAIPLPFDSLPLPDRSIFPLQEWLNTHGTLVGAECMTGRGCPYHCHYCINNTLSQLYPLNSSLSFRTPQAMIKEIQFVQKTYSNVRLIGFHNDTFLANSEWLTEFLNRYKREIALPFWCNSRPELLTPHHAGLLQKSGCTRIHIGIESGNYLLRKNMLGRDITHEVIIDAFKRTHAHGIKTVSFNILGIPQETESTLQETIALNQRCKPGWMLYSLFYPYPGTYLWDYCEEQNLIKIRPGTPEYPDSYYSGIPVIRYEHLDERILREVCSNFVTLVNQ